MFIIVLVQGTSLSACGKSASRDTGEFEPYLKKYETYFEQYKGIQIHTDDISIKSGKLKDSQLAVCDLIGDYPSITLNTEFWDKLSDDTKEITIFHEFGHCIQHRKHNNTPGSGRRWESIMEQHPQELTDYEEHKDDYLKELFLSDKSTPDEPGTN